LTGAKPEAESWSYRHIN